MVIADLKPKPGAKFMMLGTSPRLRVSLPSLDAAGRLTL